MRTKSAPTGQRKVGRPATGITRGKVTITVPIHLLAEVGNRASKANESVSQWISRAVQNQMLNEG